MAIIFVLAMKGSSSLKNVSGDGFTLWAGASLSELRYSRVESATVTFFRQ